MSEGLNQVTLLGNIGKDPELRDAGGSKVLRIRMATPERYKPANSNEWKDRTEWHTVSVFGARADALQRILAKGDRICVCGSLHTSEYTDKEGVKRWSTEINARSVFLCGKPEGRERAPAQSNRGREEPASDEIPVEDPLPF